MLLGTCVVFMLFVPSLPSRRREERTDSTYLLILESVEIARVHVHKIAQ